MTWPDLKVGPHGWIRTFRSGLGGWNARAASMRSSMVGCVWKNQKTAADGRSSARFCCPRRRIAEMNARRTPGQGQRETVGAALVVARPGVAEGREQERDQAGRQDQRRQGGRIGGAGDAGRRAEARHDGVRAEQRRRDDRRLERERRPDVVMNVVRHLVREDDLDLVVRVVFEERVRDEDAAGMADARRAPRWRAWSFRPGPTRTRRAPARRRGATASSAARAASRDRAAGSGRRAASGDRRDPRQQDAAHPRTAPRASATRVAAQRGWPHRRDGRRRDRQQQAEPSALR